MEGSGAKLSSSAKEVYGVLKLAMSYIFLDFNALFQGLVEAVKQSGEHIYNREQVVISDP